MLWDLTSLEAREETATASVTTGASSSTKGTPAQIIASTARDAHLVLIRATAYSASAAASQMAFDLLLGAATEDVFIANMLGGHAGNKQWLFPVFIPQGTRVAAQAAGARTSTAFNVQVTLFHFPGGPGFQIGSKVTTYGMGTVPNGTAITPGTSGAEGAYTQIVASTTSDHFALLPSFQVSGDTTTSLSRLRVDIGVGAATEDDFGQNWEFYVTDIEEMGGCAWPLFCRVPNGTRLAMRVSNSTGTNDAAYDGVIHGVT